MRGYTAIIAVALICGFAAVACGGASDSAASATTPTTASQPAAALSAGVRAVEGAGDPNTAWRFDPPRISVHAGDSITFTNAGKETHTVTADDGSFDLGTIDPGATKALRFDRAVTFAYHCSLHPWMKGTVTVS